MSAPVPGAFCFVLHTHLPWLPGHGVWPLGEEWFHQALVESYVPLVDELDALAAEGQRDVLSLGVTPVLAAQLDHPRMLEDARTWVGLWQQRCRDLGMRGTEAEREVARYEYRLARRAELALATRWAGGGSPVLRDLRDSGTIELLGGPAAHPVLPLLHPQVARLTLGSGLADSVWRLGHRPRGIWSPECAWDPWLGAVVTDAGVRHVVVDEQTVRDSGGHPHTAWVLTGHPVIAVPRDLEVTNLIWSSRSGYPSGAAYRDFHARETAYMSGVRLSSVTSPTTPPADKRPYDPVAAERQVDRDVEHFVGAVRRRLTSIADELDRPGLVVTAYDTELFGHWWHEGPVFLGRAVRALRDAGVQVTTLEGAIAAGLVTDGLDLRPGSWGAGKDLSVWTGPEVADIAHENHWVQRRWVDLLARERADGCLRARRPDLDQLARTMFHTLSSDWAFLVTRGQSVDYARRRARTHREDFHRLAQLIEDGRGEDALAEAVRQRDGDTSVPALDARAP